MSRCSIWRERCGWLIGQADMVGETWCLAVLVEVAVRSGLGCNSVLPDTRDPENQFRSRYPRHSEPSAWRSHSCLLNVPALGRA